MRALQDLAFSEYLLILYMGGVYRDLKSKIQPTLSNLWNVPEEIMNYTFMLHQKLSFNVIFISQRPIFQDHYLPNSLVNNVEGTRTSWDKLTLECMYFEYNCDVYFMLRDTCLRRYDSCLGINF